MRRRVVVTGIGAVSPLGCEIEHVWRRILRGDCGITVVSESLSSDIKVYGKVPTGEDEHSYNPAKVFGRDVSKELSNFLQLGIYASDLALKHANFPQFNSDNESDRAGVAIATGGMGSIQDIVATSKNLDASYRKVSPYFVPKILGNMAAGHVSIRHKFRGPLHSVSTACAAGSHAIGDAYNFIRLGYADVMLAGGAESNLDPLTIAGFARMKALCTEGNPASASRPFDSSRSGFVIAEGACVLVLEELTHAQLRGAPILAEVTGYGMSADAHHATSPSPSGHGAVRSMRVALADAQLQPDAIGYVNAHATSTPVGDAIEAAAIDTVFGADTASGSQSSSSASRSTPLYVSSTKGATGHLLGAAGALESAFAILALRDGLIPPTLNLNAPDYIPKCFHHVPNTSVPYASSTSGNNNNDSSSNSHGITGSVQTKPLLHVLKNSFGFGGTNVSLVFSKFVN